MDSSLKVPEQTQLDVWTDLETQLRFGAPGDFLVKISIRNAVIN